ncbi:hypothetical protein CK203_114701 [Vitis vinifera]|uniref:Uncharacterized protein n=1 Tax=Vitis vinifera TaxID=29760 RepID=A0A438CPR5_VITVI|nr:hypothetical protein CK203_114701 [Vitis vinifera]
MLRFGALGLVLIVSPSSELGIMHLGIRFGQFSRFIESAEPTTNPYGFLVVKQAETEGVSWPCKFKRSNEGCGSHSDEGDFGAKGEGIQEAQMLRGDKYKSFGSHHLHTRIIFGGVSELNRFGTGSAPWLAAFVSHEEHLPFFVWFSLIREPVQHHSWQPLSANEEHLPFFVWFSLIQGSPRFWHFSSPYPWGLKPICYRALVSHLEDESSLIGMTFGESLPHFNQLSSFLAQALMLDFEYIGWLGTTASRIGPVDRVRVHKLATPLGIEPRISGFIRGSSLNLSWSRGLTYPFPFVGLLIEIDLGSRGWIRIGDRLVRGSDSPSQLEQIPDHRDMDLRLGQRIDGHQAQPLPIPGSTLHDSTTPPPPPPSGPSGPTI